MADTQGETQWAQVMRYLKMATITTDSCWLTVLTCGVSSVGLIT